jgi:hypothetical protein
MELANPNLIEELLADVRGGRKKNVSADTQVSSSYQPPIAKQKRRTCRCGTCSSCADNARWERIFQTKFSDPHYNRLSTQCGSSLGLTK